MGGVIARLRALFFSRRLEVVLVGLEGSGKTTFCNYLALGKAVEEPPTVGLNVKIMKKEGVTFKVWDIGGQVQYREEWPRYARGCDVIAFVVDTQKPELVPSAKKELHQLLEARELQKVPLLILANKIDLGQKITEQELIRALNLDYISDNSWLVIPISAKTGANIDQALEFLISKSHA